MPRRRKLSKKVARRAQHLAQLIGIRLRHLRRTQGLTLAALSKRSGVDLATVSRIETGKMLGTVDAHLRLASALGIKLPALYAGIEEARTQSAITVQYREEQRTTYRSGRWSLALLTSNVLRKKLLPALITIQPGGRTATEETKVGTERFLYVLAGRIEARTGGQSHQLGKGSTLYFDASIPHSLANKGRAVARCLSMLTPPVL